MSGLAAWLVVAANEGPGQGDSTSTLETVLIVGGIVLGVAIVALLALRLTGASVRRRRADADADDEQRHSRGRVGRL